MEERVLYNVLRAISKGGTGSAEAPDGTYLSSLVNIGMITTGWDTEITSLGRSVLEHLRGKFEKW